MLELQMTKEPRKIGSFECDYPEEKFYEINAADLLM
jgi:hypothetical protein